ncbi:MAG: hypothetical protein P1U37_12870 [Minwuia sp.]|nr:hypothetical protein [Minwuia sp.]
MLKLLSAVLTAGLLAGCADIGLQSDATPRSSAAVVSTGGTTVGTAGAARSADNVGTPRRLAMTFVGESRHDLVAWLGQPDLELSEGQGSLLQFRRGQCVALAMVDEGDAVAAIEVSGIVSRADRDCAETQLTKVTLR